MVVVVDGVKSKVLPRVVKIQVLRTIVVDGVKYKVLGKFKDGLYAPSKDVKGCEDCPVCGGRAKTSRFPGCSRRCFIGIEKDAKRDAIYEERKYRFAMDFDRRRKIFESW